MINLLQQPEGATIIDLTHATGWLPHTTRAALTGLRKRGYAVVAKGSMREISTYRIVTTVADGEDRFGAQMAHRRTTTASLRRRERHSGQEL